jgi:hypothetical protein
MIGVSDTSLDSDITVLSSRRNIPHCLSRCLAEIDMSRFKSIAPPPRHFIHTLGYSRGSVASSGVFEAALHLG